MFDEIYRSRARPRFNRVGDIGRAAGGPMKGKEGGKGRARERTRRGERGRRADSSSTLSRETHKGSVSTVPLRPNSSEEDSFSARNARSSMWQPILETRITNNSSFPPESRASGSFTFPLVFSDLRAPFSRHAPAATPRNSCVPGTFGDRQIPGSVIGVFLGKSHYGVFHGRAT